MKKYTTDLETMASGKEIYDRIQIPEELADVVSRSIRSVDKRKLLKRSRQQKAMRIIKYTGSIAAALLAAATIGLNTSQAFAEALSDIPVLGALSRVLTVRSYTEKEDIANITVKVSEIQQNTDETIQNGESSAPSQETEDFIADINAEIQKIVDTYIETAKTQVEEYKQAFLETGGTEEEWNEHPIDITVTYDVKYQYGPYLSLVLYNSESWAAYSEERVYYNLDLKNNRSLTLQDILGDDYVQIANAAINEQIEERIEKNEYVYWGRNDGDSFTEGFTTVDETTKFYINAAGNPVVVFPKYEIGPGYIGVQEFEIINNDLPLDKR